MRKGFGGPELIGVLVLILITLAISILIVNKGSVLFIDKTNTAISCETPTAGVYSMCAHETYSCSGDVSAELKSGCGLKSSNMIKAFGRSSAVSYTTCCIVNVCGDVVDPPSGPRTTWVYDAETPAKEKELKCIGEAAKCNGGNNCCCTRGTGSDAEISAIQKQIDKAFK